MPNLSKNDVQGLIEGLGEVLQDPTKLDSFKRFARATLINAGFTVTTDAARGPDDDTIIVPPSIGCDCPEEPDDD